MVLKTAQEIKWRQPKARGRRARVALSNRESTRTETARRGIGIGKGVPPANAGEGRYGFSVPS